MNGDQTKTVEKFGEHPRLQCHCFQTVVDAKAEAVTDTADVLLHTSRELMSAIVSRNVPSDESLAFAAEFLAQAAHAGYRSVAGGP